MSVQDKGDFSEQVPRAPSRCTVIFGPPKDSEAERPLASGWSVHGEDRSQAALHIMPEWAEVPQADTSLVHLCQRWGKHMILWGRCSWCVSGQQLMF